MSTSPNPKLQLPKAPGWQGLLVAPLVALAALSVSHALVTPSCGWNSTLALHATFLVATLAGAASTALSLRAWRHAGGRAPLTDSGGDGGRPPDRNLFVPLLGIAAGAYFTLVIAAQWSATWVLPPCAY